ncbi:hypothetical protein [Streptomyces sp. NPDC016845]|uniref:hypothetical protein n=1 Tax=Streptomyces sp. NPDC016845 TaxID=3364972 RepID=UPI00378AC3EA
MTSVLFIHGTGVRAPGYAEALRAVRAGLAGVRPDVTVAECDWGSALGSYLRADGASIPGYVPQDPARAPRPHDEERARWALLYVDPAAELHLFALAGQQTTAPFLPGALPAGRQLWAWTQELVEAPAVRAAWQAAGLDAHLAADVSALLASDTFRRACDAADGTGASGLARLTARALTARALAGHPGGPGAVPADARDAMVAAVVDRLGGEERGLSDGVSRALGASARLLERAGGSRFVVGRRSRISERSLGFAGDILSYLVRGEAVRAYVADLARQLTPPVVLLGHSLGGIVAFDLLAGGAAGTTPDVAQLVTVGSQAPVLYELDALPSRPYGTGLPAGFPRWLNVYDRRDLLSFVGAEVFGPGVRDVEVDNGQPVSAAHSAYWTNRHLYEVLAQELPG